MLGNTCNDQTRRKTKIEKEIEREERRITLLAMGEVRRPLGRTKHWVGTPWVGQNNG